MKWLVLATALCLPATVFGQVNVEWVMDTEGVSVAVDGANNVYTVYYDYNPAGDITLTKRDTNGALLWQAGYDQIDNSKWEKATWVAADSQGNALVAGTLMSGYSSPVNAASILMKFSPSGQLLWRQVYESSFDGSYTKKCLVDENDNIYVLGMGGGPSGFVTKVKRFAPDGTPVWSWFDPVGIGAPVNFKFVPGEAIAISARGVVGSVNGYARIGRDGLTQWSQPGVMSLTVGDAAGDSAGNTYLVHGEYVMNGGTVVRKIAPDGSMLWAQTCGLTGLRIEVGSDDLPVVCGYPSSGSFGASFVKLDADGNEVWANLDADGPLSLMLHAQLLMDGEDGIYLAAGTLSQMAVCKVTSSGASAWTATTTGSYANGIALGSDGSVFVAGGDTAKLRQASLAATPLTPTPVPAPGPTVQAFPNPCRDEVSIGYELRAAGPTTLVLFDATGRAVRTLVDRHEGAGAGAIRLDTRGLPAGVYAYVLRQGRMSETRKLTVLP